MAPTASIDVSRQPITVSTKGEKKRRFEHAYQVIRSELLADFKAHKMPQEAIDWFQRNLDYNVPGGKLNRGLSVVDTVEIIKGRMLTDDEYIKAAVLGWGVELLQAFFLVTDDLMDSSITRRGQPCYYRVDGVGTIAVNDGIMLEGAIYRMLRTHFKGEPYYVELLDLFHEVTYETEMGQLMDLITAPEDKVDLNRFSLERHRLIVVYKTAFYSFYLPIALAMHMCRIPSTPKTPESDPYKLAQDVLIPLGEYFQVQDDYLDFAGTPEQIGKVGTDIVDNKCSWCINTALAAATPAQRAMLDANYGRKDADCERAVKDVFEAIGLHARYETYERDAYARINALIERVPEVHSETGEALLRREVFTSFVEKIYKRTK